MSTYHRCASVLERELGVSPDAATRATLSSGRARAHRPRAAAGAGRGRPGPPPAAPPAQLVGRGAELAPARGSAWRRAAAGRPRAALVVRGEAGVGKTRLVAELAALARRHGAVVAVAPVLRHRRAGWRWLRSRTGCAAPPSCWRPRSLRPAVARRGRPAGAVRHAPVGHRRRTAPGMVDAWQRHRFFEGLARALLAVPAGRLLLVLDNLQWCDRETLALLVVPAGLGRDAPLLVAATLREGDRARPRRLAAWLAPDAGHGPAHRARLPRWTRAETARCRRLSPAGRCPATTRDLLHAATGGFPLFVVEAARPRPARRRAAGWRPTSTACCAAASAQPARRRRGRRPGRSASGRDFTLDLLAEASDLDAERWSGPSTSCGGGGSSASAATGYDFSHDLLRDAAYDLVSPPQRWLLHRRLAQALELCRRRPGRGRRPSSPSSTTAAASPTGP